jgi:sRNA-binding protein
MQEPQNSPAPTDPEAVQPSSTEALSAPADAAAVPPAAPAIADLPPAVVAAKLAELFPALFGAGRALPIKLRIQADIQARAPGLFNKKSLSIFLHRHTTSTGYLKSLAAAPARLDLDGQPAGDIAQEHRDAAAAELARRLAIVQERRAAERKAQRQGERPAGSAQAAGPSTSLAAGAEAPAADAAGDGAPVAVPSDRSDRPPRPPRQDRPDRPPRGDRPPRSDRPPRLDRPPRADRGDRPWSEARPARGPQAPQGQQAQQAQQAPAAPREPQTPEQAAEFEARRSRSQVLRAFEATTLTRANFCALKGMNDAALEAILVQARAERGDRAGGPPPLKAPAGRPISR